MLRDEAIQRLKPSGSDICGGGLSLMCLGKGNCLNHAYTFPSTLGPLNLLILMNESSQKCDSISGGVGTRCQGQGAQDSR